MIYGNFMMQGHANNSPFVEEDGVHRYNPTDTSRMLRQEFLKHGIEINTPDMNLGRKISFELHIEGRPLRVTFAQGWAQVQVKGKGK